MATWVDFSRRNDPACEQAFRVFCEQISRAEKSGKLPEVICFWTKNPGLVADLYAGPIQYYQRQGVTFLAQVTVNDYGREIEPGAPDFESARAGLRKLAKWLPANAIRLRLDPIIPGVTAPRHIKQLGKIVVEFDISRITVNMIQWKYKGIDKLWRSMDKEPIEWDEPKKLQVLQTIRDLVPSQCSIAACAETSWATEHLPWLQPTGCATPEWAGEVLGYIPEIFGHASRQFCGCLYSGDWGQYASKGGWKCPHQCAYCYAK